MVIPLKVFGRGVCIARVVPALMLVLAGCGATPSPPSKPVAEATRESDARGVTLRASRGEVQALVLPDKALPGQYVVAFSPGLTDEIAAAAPALAAAIGTATGKTPLPTMEFYTTAEDRFYLGQGAERYCVQVIRETEDGGIVSMRFGRAGDTRQATTVAAR